MWYKFASDFDNQISSAATGAGVNPKIFKTLMEIESDFNPKSQSSKGATGLTQLMPETAKEMAEKQNIQYKPNNKAQNIQMGANYLGHLLQVYHNYTFAVGAYNTGQGNFNKWLRGEWKNLPSETFNYINKFSIHVDPYLGKSISMDTANWLRNLRLSKNPKDRQLYKRLVP
jgi:hypothetical protein